MKVYFACSSGSDLHFHLEDLSRVLVAYPMLTGRIQRMLLGHDFFLDSGAFSVSTGKAVVDIDKYIDFILQHKVKTYAALDVIGNSEASHANYLHMRSRGTRPIPALHYEQPLTHLDYYLDDTDYIACGGVAHLKWGNRKAMPFLNTVFERIARFHMQSRPLPKVHGFGITTKNLVEAFPFYSVDSSSWKLYSAYGMLMTSEGKSISSPRSGRFDPRKHMTHENPVFHARHTLMRRQIRELLELERNTTTLWERRGAKWQ